MARMTLEDQERAEAAALKKMQDKLKETQLKRKAAEAARLKEMQLKAGAAVVAELEERPDGELAGKLRGLLTERVSKTNLKNLFGIEKEESLEEMKAVAEQVASAA